MKSIFKVALAISLFSSITLAEGDMGTGGFTDGDMGTGGRTCTQNCQTSDQTIKTNKNSETFDSVLDYIQKFLFEIFG